MPPIELALAVLALLLTPGPTNSLMLILGAERGLTGAVRLIPAELAGYLVTILPLTLVGPALVDAMPGLHRVVVLAAAGWVAWLAFRLWQLPLRRGAGGSVGAKALAVTTALNPKALIFGLVLLPSTDGLGANLALFSGLVVLVAMVWAALGAGLGAGLQRGGTRGPGGIVIFRRLASVWLAAISVTLALRGIGA